MKKIKLTQGRFALVDDEDFIWLSKYKWCFNVKSRKLGKDFGYAQRTQHIYFKFKKRKSKTIYMHREILKTKKEIDHINSNTLDNRKQNLRPADRTLQSRNSSSRRNSTSKYVGVHKHKATGKWCVQIKINYRAKYLGLFSNEEDAKLARKRYIIDNNLKGFKI